MEVVKFIMAPNVADKIYNGPPCFIIEDTGILPILSKLFDGPPSHRLNLFWPPITAQKIIVTPRQFKSNQIKSNQIKIVFS